jgi:uncharacterized protein
MSIESVLVTGASSGIGRELAKRFAADGCRLVLVARSGGALESLAGELKLAHKTDARVVPTDLAQPEAPVRLLEHLRFIGIKVDVLVNNAGFGAVGQFAELPLGHQLAMLQVNVTTLTHLTRLLLPGMIERRRGGILNVASTASFQPGPGMAVYFATKSYVLSFSEALAEELAGTGVTATALCPGPTATNFRAAANASTTRPYDLSAMTAESVAKIGHQAFRRGQVVVVPGLRNRIFAFAVRFAPRAFVRKAVKHFNAAKANA